MFVFVFLRRGSLIRALCLAMPENFYAKLFFTEAEATFARLAGMPDMGSRYAPEKPRLA